MTTIVPFKALRPVQALAAQVASRPYDVLNSQEAREEVKNNPHSFLRITKSEVDLDKNIDIHSPAVYEKAKENLRSFIEKGTLFREEKPCFYIYRLIMNGRSQTGLVCGSSIDDYENDIIKKHEFTRPEKEQDRINHIKTSGAQTGNVFLAYKNVEALDAIIDTWVESHTPEYDFVAEDNITHTIWVVDQDEIISAIQTIFKEKVPCTYIADGHHRAASAAKVRKSSDQRTSDNANYFLTTLFPSDQLHILDYNRVVKDLNGLSATALLEQLNNDFEVQEANGAVSPEKLHDFGMYLAGKWYRLTTREGRYAHDPIGVLDVTILTNLILDKILGIKDQRTDARIDFVGGIRGLGELEKRVNSGEMAVAFSLHPVTIQQLFDIADSGNVMPPKSTWFEPKLRDGLLTHLIYE